MGLSIPSQGKTATPISPFSSELRVHLQVKLIPLYLEHFNHIGVLRPTQQSWALIEVLPGHRLICYSSSFCQQCVPYLIAIGTDEEQQMRVKSDQQLSEIDSKYSMFVQVSKRKTLYYPCCDYFPFHVQPYNGLWSDC